MTARRLEGLRVLVAEDELLLALDLCDMLKEAGCEILGPARSLAATEALAANTQNIHIALLDLNLAGESSLDLASRLASQGTPVIITTGYDQADLPADFQSMRICVKPIASGLLLRSMEELLAERTN